MTHSMAVERPGGLPEQADEALVGAARSGDPEAFALLVDRYRGLAFAYAFARLQDRDEAEDLAQELFACAYISLGRLRGTAA